MKLTREEKLAVLKARIGSNSEPVMHTYRHQGLIFKKRPELLGFKYAISPEKLANYLLDKENDNEVAGCVCGLNR